MAPQELWQACEEVWGISRGGRRRRCTDAEIAAEAVPGGDPPQRGKTDTRGNMLALQGRKPFLLRMSGFLEKKSGKRGRSGPRASPLPIRRERGRAGVKAVTRTPSPTRGPERHQEQEDEAPEVPILEEPSPRNGEDYCTSLVSRKVTAGFDDMK